MTFREKRIELRSLYAQLARFATFESNAVKLHLSRKINKAIGEMEEATVDALLILVGGLVKTLKSK
jgi:hypothetical protein